MPDRRYRAVLFFHTSLQPRSQEKGKALHGNEVALGSSFPAFLLSFASFETFLGPRKASLGVISRKLLKFSLATLSKIRLHKKNHIF